MDKETEIQWVKHGSDAYCSVLGKDILVFSSGNYITFVEMARADKRETIYNANTEVRGDGIQILSTHPSLPCFAFSEKCRNPRIFMLSFPSFEVIKAFECVTETNYLAMRFTEMEFLIALTGIPDFKLVIWNWRTSEKIFSQETKMDAPLQILRVSISSPIQILQGTEKDGRMICWDMNVCFKKTVLNRKFIQLPENTVPPYCHCFGADGDVYFADATGSLYSVNTETLVFTLHFSFAGGQVYTTPPYANYIPCVIWYKGGIAFSTPVDIVYFRRKSPEGWTKMWSYTPKLPCKKLLTSCLKDFLVGINILNEVILYRGEPPIEYSGFKSVGADFEFVCFLSPVGDHIVTFGNMSRMFTVWNKTNGQRVTQFQWVGGLVKDVKSNPRWPYLAAVTSEGVVAAINTYDPQNLTEMDQNPLTDNCLHAIKFSQLGETFCVANMDVGEFFLLRLPHKTEVLAYLILHLKIVDYAVLDKEVGGVKLIVVPMSQFCCRSGQTALLYTVNDNSRTLEHVRDVSFPSIVTKILLSPTNHREIICVLHRSRRCLIMNFIDGKTVHEFITGHQMKLISIQTEGEHLITYGADGLVIVKVASTKKCATLFLTHHRLGKGIASVAFDPYMSFVAVLGANGSLVCVRLRHMRRQELKQALTALMNTPEYKHTFHPSGRSRSRYSAAAPAAESLSASSTHTKARRPNWLVQRHNELLNIEEHESYAERESILQELDIIKRKLSDLVDANILSVPERQLPIQAFDLDKANRRKKLEDSKVEREKEKLLRQAKMKGLSRLMELIRATCWDTIAVKGREIHGIRATIVVQSYPLLPEKKDFKQTMIWLGEAKKLMKFFKTGDRFEPWVPRTDSALELHVNTKFQVSSLDVTQTIKTKYEEEQLEDEKLETEAEELELQYVWSGTSTHNFVEVDPLHYNQFELTTFLQSHQEIRFIENDIKKLMLWFNKEFADTFVLKEQEMQFVLDRNGRFRHIIKELSFFNFSPTICKTTILDPEWAPEENPETILTVADEEVTVPRYMSQSELDVLHLKMEEEERLRVLMSDDFRERALMAMMDGVLEKLWEDEIKKDVPKPKCMLEKDPENFTEDDMRAIKLYEESVKFLASERERYRKILEGKWVKTISTVRDSITRFDEKVFKLHILKLKVESAMGQEILKCLRIRKFCFDRIQFDRKIDIMKVKIVKNEKKIEAMTAELNKLIEVQTECKSGYEVLQNKDKNLDRNFKKEFPEYSTLTCDQLYKLSKKRPKLPQRAALFSTVLIDLGKCAVSGLKPEYMPMECIQYLRDIDILDSSANCPAVVSQQSWEMACKLRRLKIETELRMRAFTVDMAEADAAIAYHQKMIKTARDQQTQLQNELQAFRLEGINTSLNKQIQLVLKRGLVEIPLTGDLSDFDESILVTKDTLNEVNKAIHKIGEQKIKAMKRAANFRKGIIYKEWEHKKLRMEIEDLKAHLETIEKFQVLKELQAILVARARGFPDEKGFLYLENELSKAKEKYEKTKVDIKAKITKLDEKIQNLVKENKYLDLQIMELNVEVNEMNLSRDIDFDQRFLEENLRRMKKVRERSRIIRKIQEQHNEILVLQTELELLRLRTYPTIKHKIS